MHPKTQYDSFHLLYYGSQGKDSIALALGIRETGQSDIAVLRGNAMAIQLFRLRCRFRGKEAI